MSWDVKQLPSGCLLYQHPRFSRAPSPSTLRRKRGKKLAEPRNAAVASILMPFGQYKGLPLADILRDINYVGWLLAQDWFAEKFPTQRRYLADAFTTRDDAEGPSAA